MTSSDRLARSWLLWLSSSAVVVTAVGFDVLADEPPVHTLAIALAAIVIGVGRRWLQGRLAGVLVAVNLAVLGQPAVHALTKLTHASADALPHSHVVPESLSGIALHVAVAMLVVAVAASEPACLLVSGIVLRALRHLHALLTRAPIPVGPVTPLRRRGDEPPLLLQLVGVDHSVSRRGPPAAFGLAG